MKRSYVIAISIIIILLLGIRAIYLMAHRGDEEQEWFWKNLNYDFGARIDSVMTRGNKKEISFIYFHKFNGQFDPYMDQRLDRQLKHRHAHFILRNGQSFQFFTRLDSIRAGDSVAVNSGKNSIIVYRAGKKIRETEVGRSVFGKPFR